MFARDGLPTGLWLLIHLLSSLVYAIALVSTPGSVARKNQPLVGLLALAIGIAIPFAGAVGFACALFIGGHYARLNHREKVYWQFTENAQLPFTVPLGRKTEVIDSRSFTEQIEFSENPESLYRKVLAAANMRSSLSVATLRKAIRHKDERIRLTAYQTLDRKITQLNLSIQRLEKSASTEAGQDKSNTWLQIASNYWELLTLEDNEPVARAHLLEKAYAAAEKSIAILPSNRNAHFTLGRIALMRNDPAGAREAFLQTLKMGMPREKVLPYLAEAAFNQRDFAEVKKLLASVDEAFKLYPPLSHVAKYWS